MDPSAAEALAWLRLQLEWGADEAIGDMPVSRLAEDGPFASARLGDAGTSRAAASKPVAPSRTRTQPGLPAPAQDPRGAAQAGAETAAQAADSLEALCAAIRGFTGCSLRDTAGHTLCPEGPVDAGLLLIGEVPGPDEDRAGRLFAGPAGELLDRMLGSIGLERAALLAAPLIPWRPPGDRKVSPAEMALCLPFLRRLVALSRPRRVLLLGVRPARAWLGEEPFARLRGRWRTLTVPDLAASGAETTLPALAMRHPSFLLANPPARREAWSDLLLLRRTLDEDGPPVQAA